MAECYSFDVGVDLLAWCELQRGHGLARDACKEGASDVEFDIDGMTIVGHRTDLDHRCLEHVEDTALAGRRAYDNAHVAGKDVNT